jgi:hypothetical protein
VSIACFNICSYKTALVFAPNLSMIKEPSEVQKRRVDPNQLELNAFAANCRSLPEQQYPGNSARSHERIHVIWMIGMIVIAVAGLIVLTELLHLDPGPVREVIAVCLVSLWPIIDRIVRFYFPAARN